MYHYGILTETQVSYTGIEISPIFQYPALNMTNRQSSCLHHPAY